MTAFLAVTPAALPAGLRRAARVHRTDVITQQIASTPARVMTAGLGLTHSGTVARKINALAVNAFPPIALDVLRIHFKRVIAASVLAVSLAVFGAFRSPGVL